jgi:hypothetical protein
LVIRLIATVVRPTPRLVSPIAMVIPVITMLVS